MRLQHNQKERRTPFVIEKIFMLFGFQKNVTDQLRFSFVDLENESNSTN